MEPEPLRPVETATGLSVHGGAMELIDRHAERDTLDRFVAAVRTGESQALVMSGEAGIGKTALLEYLAANASGCRIARTTGVQSEMELCFAALHQLCAPMLDGLQRLPPPQRDAVRTAFGMGSGPVPDRFLVGLGILGLLSEAGEEQPLVCLIDDEQWLDRASAQVLGFVARRLVAESVGMVFAARVPSSELTGLAELSIEGLSEADARTLLDSVLTGPLDPRVRDQILAETHGNPLALLELPRGLTSQRLAGGYGLPGALRLSGGIDECFRQRCTSSRNGPSCCCWSPRPCRSVIRDWCGEPPRGWGLAPTRRSPRSRGAWSSAALGCGFGIRSCARSSTDRRCRRSGERCMRLWLRPPIPS